MRLLIVNPNTNATMTDLMVAEAREICGPDTEITGISAEFGVPYIATRSEMAIAGYALLETLARHHKGHDAVIIGAFCHSIVPAAKELMPVPVVGIAEAAMRAAQLLGRRISIIGLGAPERGANEEIVSELNMTADMASIRILGMSGSELATDQGLADAEAIRLGLAAVTEDHADALVLGGAAFAGMARRIKMHLPVPLISPIPYAVKFAEAAVLQGWQKPASGTFSVPGKKPMSGISPELGAFFSE